MTLNLESVVEEVRKRRRKRQKYKKLYVSEFVDFRKDVEKSSQIELLEEEDAVYLKVDVPYHDVGSGLIIGPIEYRPQQDSIPFGPLICLECENDLFYASNDEYYCPKCEGTA